MRMDPSKATVILGDSFWLPLLAGCHRGVEKADAGVPDGGDVTWRHFPICPSHSRAVLLGPGATPSEVVRLPSASWGRFVTRRSGMDGISTRHEMNASELKPAFLFQKAPQT